ncbi:DoxX family protein [Pedobacter sp. BMA]|uniref:DoxX family protein n=1 Tax=Pedobacter sp. BMA TaxID=1663685 RepID=UPI000649A22E|nr:DoxX family protein [Pedobacter sp. BMA]KLT67074.1 hypothetical protein AB669_04025 [Pedobacter sp. BMA]
MTDLFETRHSKLTDMALLAACVVIWVMMLSHGLPKVTMLLNDAVYFFSVMGISPTVSLALTLFAQIVCCLFVVTGDLTRLAFIPLIVNTMVAIVIVHGREPNQNRELAWQFPLLYIKLFLTGPGRYAIDRPGTKIKK